MWDICLRCFYILFLGAITLNPSPPTILIFNLAFNKMIFTTMTYTYSGIFRKTCDVRQLAPTNRTEIASKYSKSKHLISERKAKKSRWFIGLGNGSCKKIVLSSWNHSLICIAAHADLSVGRCQNLFACIKYEYIVVTESVLIVELGNAS